MRPLRRLVVVVGTIVALAAVAPSALASSPLGGDLHVTKTCTVDSILKCTIQTSTLGILVGAVGTYNGPLFSPRLSSEVVLVTWVDGTATGTATGHCTLNFQTNLGTCTFARGTGSLAGFHANLKITDHPDTGVTNWDGTYFFVPTD